MIAAATKLKESRTKLIAKKMEKAHGPLSLSLNEFLIF